MQPRINVQEVNLDRLAEVIREEGIPIPLEALVREAIRSYLTTDNGVPVFAPGGRYTSGRRLRYHGFVGDIVDVESGQNAVQGAFKILTLRLKEGGRIRVAAGIDHAPTSSSPEMISGQLVDTLFADQKTSLIPQVRQALAADPRFVTLYYRGEEYGCLRAFFPPMSPDVLDAALAVLLDSLFDRGQIAIHRLTVPSEDEARPGPVFQRPGVLFSEPFLERALRGDTDWDADLGPIYEVLRSLWARSRLQGRNWDGQQTDTSLVQPILTALGWSSVPLSVLDPKAADSDKTAGPRVLCRDQAACAALCAHQGNLRSASGWAPALVQSVPWSGSLSGYSQSKSRWWELEGALKDAIATPIYQMVRLLMRYEVRWGILTNGRQWRLFTRRANSLVAEFHEVDLGPLFERLSEGESLTPSDWADLRQWWMLFRRDAFVDQGRERSFIDRLYVSSPTRQYETLAHLQQRLIDEVFPTLVGGFVTYRHRRMRVSEEDAASLSLIKRAGVSLLARILFLLAAEAQYLLPVDDPEYYSQSLTSLLSWADSCAEAHIAPSDGLYSTSRYDVLLSLLHRVNRGDASKSLPEYGPVFFDPHSRPEHAFIAENRLSDARLAEVLNVLQREIDGMSFDAYKLRAALEPLLDLELRVIDAAEAEVDLLDASSVSDRHFRAGVPDYVAKDVAAHAIQPLLEQRGTRFVQAMDRVVALRHTLQRTLDLSNRAELQVALETASREACEAFLGLRVVDPAMGSGTFLLSALDVITDSVIAHTQAYHEAHPEVPRRWNPMQRLLDRVRHDVASELRRQGIEVADRSLDDVSLMRRLIAQHCIYGVEREPSAADLTQISLWLRTFTVGAPLIFFDHRLRTGEGLIGTTLDSLRKLAPKPTDLMETFDGVGMMYSVIDRVNTSSLDVRWSMKQFERVEQAIDLYRQVCDLNVAAALGDTEAQGLLSRHGASLLSALKKGAILDDEMATALRCPIYTGHYFHWPLMFLDAYVDFERGSWSDEPGFDAVIGQVPAMSGRALERIAWLVPDSGKPAPVDSHQGFIRMAHRLKAHRDGQTSCVFTHPSRADKWGNGAVATSDVQSKDKHVAFQSRA